MQMCPWCDKVYDESEYSHCPYCSGELVDEDEEIRPCPECGGCLHWDGEIWECSNCDYSEEDQEWVLKSHFKQVNIDDKIA